VKTCRKTKLSNEQDGTNSMVNLQARRQGNLYAKKCTTFEKESTARDRRNRRFRLVSRRLVVPESDCYLPSGEKSLPVAARRRNAISGKVKDRADRCGPRKGAPGRSYEPSGARDVPLHCGKPHQSRLRHKHHLRRKDLYQMVLHRPVEPASSIRIWLSGAKRIRVAGRMKTI